MNCLRLLYIKPLLVLSLRNIFFHFVGCLFVLSLVSFVVQKLFNLKQIPLIFAFVSFVLEDRSQNILLLFMSKSFLPMVSSRNFVALNLIFRSLFEFILVYLSLFSLVSLFEFIVGGVRECSDFLFLYVAVQFSQHHLSKRLLFLHCVFLSPLLQINCLQLCGFISGFSSVPLIYVSIFVPVLGLLFLNQISHTTSFTWAFSQLTFKRVIDKCVPIAILLFVFQLFLQFFILFFSFSFLLCSLMTLFSGMFVFLSLVFVHLLQIFDAQLPWSIYLLITSACFKLIII